MPGEPCRTGWRGAEQVMASGAGETRDVGGRVRMRVLRRPSGGLEVAALRPFPGRQLLQTVDQLSRLSLTMAVLRDQQGRSGRGCPARCRAAHRRADPAHPSRVRQRPRADIDAGDGTDNGQQPNPTASARTGVRLARSPGRPWTGTSSRPVAVIRPSGGSTGPGKGQDPCRWRAKVRQQHYLPLPVGAGHFRSLAGQVDGQGSGTRRTMIACHRPPPKPHFPRVRDGSGTHV